MSRDPDTEHEEQEMLEPGGGLKSMMSWGEMTMPTRKDRIHGTGKRFAGMMESGRTRVKRKGVPESVN